MNIAPLIALVKLTLVWFFFCHLWNIIVYDRCNIFSLYRSEILQKVKKWCMFRVAEWLSKFYYLTHLFEVKLSKKFEMSFFFWGILYWNSSKMKKVVGGLILQTLEYLPPPPLFIFEPKQHNVPKKKTFFM